MAKKIFVSYSSKQTEFANKIRSDLEKEGFETWIDKTALRYTVIWTQELTEAIIQNDCVLLLWSSDAKASENVHKEIITARALLKPIIPFLVDGEKGFPVLPKEIGFLQGIVRDEYEKSVQELLNRLSDEELNKIRYPLSSDNLYIPRNRNDYFVGRQADLVKLFVDLCGFFGAKARNDPNAIVGLAGIGKTEMAVEFAYRFSILFPNGVYWIDADKDDLTSEFVKLAPHLKMQPLAEESKSDFAKRILGQLRNLPESLLILDGVMSSKTFSEWCPAGARACAVLITTRLMLQEGRIQLLQLKELDQNSAFELLISRRRDILQKDLEVVAAKKICKLIGNLPLALELFASHLSRIPMMSAQQFLRELENVSPISSHAHTEVARSMLMDTGQNLFSFFNLIYEKLNRDRTDPYFFLLSSFSAETSVKYEFIENAFGNPIMAMEAIQQLHENSLLSYDIDKRVSIHPLVISFARALQDSQRLIYQKKFVEIMTGFVQTHNEIRDIEIVLPETSHIEYAIQIAAENGFISEVKILYANYAIYLAYRCEYDHQLDCLQKSMALHEKDTPQNIAQIASLSLDVGRVLKNKGDFSNAKIRVQTALELFERTFGQDHAEVAN